MNNHNHIVTGPDRLLDLVNEKEEISLSAAAETLNVSRSIVEHWTETLAEQKLLSINSAWNEIYLQNNDFHKHRPSLARKVRRHFSAIVPSHKRGDENKALREKEIEIDIKLEMMNDKLKELKKYEQVRLESEEKIIQMSKIEKEISRKQAIINREKEWINKKHEEISFVKTNLDSDNKLIEDKITLNRHILKEVNDSRELARKERVMLEGEVRNFIQEKTAFEKQRSMMSAQIKSFSELLRSLKKHKDDFQQKERELYLKAKDQEQALMDIFSDDKISNWFSKFF